jgi:uncharacterized protein (TIGR02996 family)
LVPCHNRTAIVSEPFDPRLDEAILAEPEASAPRQVLADFLEEHGHPRAELIRLFLANKYPFEWITKHRDLLGLHDAIKVRWRDGFVDEVTLVNQHETPLTDLWPLVATHRTYRFAREPTIIRHGFAFDAALPPPSGIRTLRIDYGAAALRSLPNVPWPRVNKLIVEQHMSSAIADVGVIAVAIDALPALDTLEVSQCLDEPAVTALAACIVRTPRLRSIKLDRLSEDAARMFVEAGRPITLVTRGETVTTATRNELSRIARWTSDPPFEGRSRTVATTPQRAPAYYATLAPVTVIQDASGWETEWAGSGVPLPEHPIRTWGSSICGACNGTNTDVVWAHSEHVLTHGGWSERDVYTYELVCRACGHFTTYGD